MSNASRRNERYANDPVYRRKMNDKRNARRRRKYANDPEYREKILGEMRATQTDSRGRHDHEKRPV
jgi:hypothetical protein